MLFKFKPGQKVLITRGSFKGEEAEIEDTKKGSFFGYLVKVPGWAAMWFSEEELEAPETN